MALIPSGYAGGQHDRLVAEMASTISNHRTMFVGFSAVQQRLAKMLESMAGLGTGVRDALTHYTVPSSGGYYSVPSTKGLRQSR